MNHKAFTESLNASVSEEEALKSFKEKEYQKYTRLYEDKRIENYFHFMVASILMTHHKRYRDNTVESPYRFKSPESMKTKFDDYSSSITINPNENGNPNFSMKEIKDAFAMKIISYKIPPIFYSSDPEIMQLINEKVENHKLLGEMQEFESRLIEDEYSTPKKYKYDCTKYEYFNNCKVLLNKILTLVDPNATNLINYYNKQISNVDNCINFIVAANAAQSPIDKDDLSNKKINFFEILDDFTSRIHDKLDLAILTKQVESLFSDNPVFEKLHISLDPKIKKKRTEDGFVANFIYICTPFGKIECQLQPKHEYEEGNYGYAAHTKLTGKAIRPLEIPSIDDKEKINAFVQKVKQISPKSYLARIDSTEQDRVVTQQFSDYQNYKNLTSQVTKGDPCEKYLLNYFGRLYAIQSQIFQSRENSLGFVEDDIENYINSAELSQLIEEYSQDYTK